MSNDNYKSKVLLVMGDEIKKVRKKKKLTGTQLASLIDVSQQQISRYERGCDNMKVNTLLNILSTLDISPNDYMKNVFEDTRLSDM
ncbi:helix-turn-helix protein [Providencia alcalifaciens]|uniref:Helix-turn-helix protein n=1 Tax=Providencia alcalifaciens TaxID=126385 RepID=A0A4V2V3D7_9GAMM|nr:MULTISPECIES: helix-turn-helix transcriptional regulator [Providencia]MBC5791440.1 helix-turn-helix transcriptional regulator [Providencia sp. JUb39]MTC45896.1 helix-turn-helix domain-containing protein [Providencia sp. wls1922]TCT31540.1 helix-turn-helix protein [Providencia alcalifaciens]